MKLTVSIDSLYKDWFRYLDTLLSTQQISHTLFTFNHHVLFHIPDLIERLGCLRAYSARSLERKIGSYKRAIRSNNAAGINGGNHLEKESIFAFIESEEVIALQKDNTKDKSHSFRYHPSYSYDTSNKNLPQLWSPIYNTLSFETLQSLNTYLFGTDATHADLYQAMWNYYGILTSQRNPSFTNHHLCQSFECSPRLWMDSYVYTSTAYKQHDTKATRGNEYCMFDRHQPRE